MNQQKKAYDAIDRFLRNNLDDSDYADYSKMLDALALPDAEPLAMAVAETTYECMACGATATKTGSNRRCLNCSWDEMRVVPQPAIAPEPVKLTEKRWPFVETPGAFAERLKDALAEFGSVLAAVRHVLIESPPTLSAPQPAIAPVYLNNGTRHKVASIDKCTDGQIRGLPAELIGRWVALVAADDDCHLQPAIAPEPVKLTDAKPPTVAEATELLVSALRDSKGWMRNYARSLIQDAIDCVEPQPAIAPEAVALTEDERVEVIQNNWGYGQDNFVAVVLAVEALIHAKQRSQP